ncbi:MAG: hypothetical protein U1D06_11600, partial [Paracoccaceae bacterium]|nr:hypothetical protein [Paracoccaceae bacterium]
MGKKRLKARKEARKQGLAGSLVRPIGNQHPVLVQAISNGARLDRADYEVAHVPNPYGEVIVRGELRRHAGVRRVPRFETLHRTKGISDDVLACLVWYAARLAAAQAGMVRCGLDVSGTGGGSAFHHIPVQQAAMEARSDVDWARGFIPGGELLAVFDRVMGNLESEGDEG